jgi:hypothetical protein
MKKIIKLVVVISCTFLASCSTLVSSVTQSFAQDLSAAILDNEDIDMVKAGAPAYLILLDGLVGNSPDDHFLLRQSAVLHSAYAGAFVDDLDRAKLLALKAKKLAMKAGCVSLKDACLIATLRYQDLTVWLNRQDDSSIANLYTIASTWIGWIQANSDSYDAIADLSKAKAVMLKVVNIDPLYENGQPYLYLGALESLVPPGLGGKPEKSKAYFEKAITISNGQNLMSKVLYAQMYARLIFDRDLHDSLLIDALEASVTAPGLTLMNAVAKKQAKQLLISGDDYF